MGNVRDEGKYRLRTWLRGHLPRGLSWLAPKGRSECGAHEWYVAERGTWRCYHCEAGVAHESPWSPQQETRYRLAALVESLRVLAYRPISAETVDEERRLLAELAETVDREAELVSA